MTEELRTVGPWTLIEQLGRGGNATVWKAARDTSDPIALKVINTTKAQRESYRQFVPGIEFLRTVKDIPGVAAA